MCQSTGNEVIEHTAVNDGVTTVRTCSIGFVELYIDKRVKNKKITRGGGRVARGEYDDFDRSPW